MNKDTIHIAMIGAGGMANSVHYPSLASFSDVEFAGICDLNTERLQATADKYGIENRFTDYRKMIEETAPDGVYVIGPPAAMFDIWIWCLQQGLNLYIEKPMGLSRHQAQMLAELAKQQGVITQVSHQRRTSPLLVKLREACLQRGPIYYAVCEFFKCQPTPMYTATDHMMDDCVHAIDTVRWMCGGEVIEVRSHCRRLGVPDINFIDATLLFDNGALGHVINTWASGRRVFRVQMHAPDIYTDAEVEGKGFLYADGDYSGQEFDCFEVAGARTNWEAFGFKQKNREFIDSLKTGIEVTSSPFRDCVKTMQVAETILAQALLRGR